VVSGELDLRNAVLRLNVSEMLPIPDKKKDSGNGISQDSRGIPHGRCRSSAAENRRSPPVHLSLHYSYRSLQGAISSLQYGRVSRWLLRGRKKVFGVESG